MLQNNQFSVFHSTVYPWQYVDSDQVLHLMICVKGAGPISIKCLACDPCDTDKGVFGEDRPRLFTYEMRCEMEGPGIQYFTLHIPMNTHKLRYHFSISVLGHTYLYLSLIHIFHSCGGCGRNHRRNLRCNLGICRLPWRIL